MVHEMMGRVPLYCFNLSLTKCPRTVFSSTSRPQKNKEIEDHACIIGSRQDVLNTATLAIGEGSW